MTANPLKKLQKETQDEFNARLGITNPSMSLLSNPISPFLQPQSESVVAAINSGLNTVRRTLAIDSMDRDRNIFPDLADYEVKLLASDTYNGAHSDRRYRNVTEIELMTFCVPNVNGLADEPYLLLDIEQLVSKLPMYDATNTQTSKAFARIFLKPMNAGEKYLTLDKTICDSLVLRFPQAPMASIDTLKIKILKRDGTLFDFGTDNIPPDPPDFDLQNTMSFNITMSVTGNTRFPMEGT